MLRVVSGSQHNLRDTEAFIELLNNLSAYKLDNFFDSNASIIVSRAPGRLDLMGGIADYSGSLVLELPIGDATHAALQLSDSRVVRIVSLAGSAEPARIFQFPMRELSAAGGPIEYSASRRLFEGENSWAAYVAGAFLVLQRELGIVFDQGARLLLRSTVPEGKGVSSSAALEVATMKAIATGYGVDLPCREIAFLCQKVENLVAGAPCGVMDQMTAACGQADQLLELLCQPGELRGTIGLPSELAVWGIDSGIRHSVGGADYGTVRTAAFMGYRMIAELAGLACLPGEDRGHIVIDDPEWRGYLANIDLDEFEREYAAQLPESMVGDKFLELYQGITDPVTRVQPDRAYPVLQATRHPVHEHHRVMTFARILESWNDLAQASELGELMYQSHKSYSACGLGSSGTDELVQVVRELGAPMGLYGAKITGGGSGGTVAILGHRDVDAQVRAVAAEYKRRTNGQPTVIAGSSPGADLFGHLQLENYRELGN